MAQVKTFTPDLIGKIVTITVIRKSDFNITGQAVGLLAGYSITSEQVSWQFQHTDGNYAGKSEYIVEVEAA